jgi:hypothetical protein
MTFKGGFRAAFEQAGGKYQFRTDPNRNEINGGSSNGCKSSYHKPHVFKRNDGRRCRSLGRLLGQCTLQRRPFRQAGREDLPEAETDENDRNSTRLLPGLRLQRPVSSWQQTAHPVDDTGNRTAQGSLTGGLFHFHKAEDIQCQELRGRRLTFCWAKL